METLKKIVTNQYFPAGAVLTAVLLFWAVGLLGGLSLLNNNQPPLTTLTWMLFVYMAAVLTPLAGAAAAVDLIRRWRRNRSAEAVQATYDVQAAPEEELHEEEPQEGDAQKDEAQPAAPTAQVEPAAAAGQADPARPSQPSHAATASQPKKSPKQAGRKQAA